MIPNNIGLFVAESDYRKDAVLAALSNPNDLTGNLVQLSKHWSIKVHFNAPTVVRINRCKVVEVDQVVLARFFKGPLGSLYYTTRRTGRTGWSFGGALPKVVGYDLVDQDQVDQFKTYEQFARRFDRRFITEGEIRKLWNKTSGQHGGKYKPSDFRTIGSKGQRVVRRFLENFAGIDTPPGPHKAYYEKTDNETGKTRFDYTEYENFYGSSHFGRDISISHLMGHPYIWYSSEFAGCGNGRYGLLATEKTFLWLEDD